LGVMLYMIPATGSRLLSTTTCLTRDSWLQGGGEGDVGRMGGEGDGGEGREKREGGRGEIKGRREREEGEERKVRGKGVHYFDQFYTSTPTQKCSRNKIYK